MLLALQGQRGAEPERPEVHHRDGAGRLRAGRRRAVAGRQPDRAEEAADERGRPNEPAPQDRRRSDRRRTSARRRRNRRGGGDFRWSPPRPSLVVAAAIAASIVMLVAARERRRTAVRDVAALGLRARLHDHVHVAGSVPRQRLCRPRPGAGHRRLRQDVQGEDERDRRPGRAGRTDHRHSARRRACSGGTTTAAPTSWWRPRSTTTSPDGKSRSRAETAGW